MNQKFNRILALSLAVILFCSLFSVPANVGVVEAAKVSYSGSSSYESGKYYTQLLNVELTDDPRTNLLNVAKSQLGYQEGSSLGQYSGLVAGSSNCTEFGYWYTNYTNQTYTYANAQWCAMFVSWCAHNAGISESIIKCHSYTETQWAMFVNQGRSYTWEEVQIGEYSPLPGDIVYFLSQANADSTSNPRKVNHVGIVTGFSESGTLYTIEGNAQSDVFTTDGGCVTTRSYPASSHYVAYVCSPNYGGTSSGEYEPISVEGDYIPSNVQSVVFDAEYYAAKNSDVVAGYGNTREGLYKHFIDHGVSEGRQGSAVFSVKDFVEKNATVKNLYGGSTPDYKSAIIYFGNTAAFNDTTLYKTATPENMGSSFSSKIALTNASLNFSLSDTDVIAYTPSSAAAQIYNFERQSDGTYKAVNTKNNYVLEIASNSKASGTNVQIGVDTGANTQRWNIFKNHDGTYILQNVCAPACVVSVSTNSPAAMDSIILSTYKAQSSQKFKLTNPNVTTGDKRLDLSSLPTSGTFTAAGFDKWTYFLNMGNGGKNDAYTHSIGTINLALYDKIVIRYGSDPNVSKLGTLSLKTKAGTTLDSKVITPARGWKSTVAVEFDVSDYTNNEELVLNYSNVSNGILVTRITLVVPDVEITPEPEPEPTPSTELKIDAKLLTLYSDITVKYVVKKAEFDAAGYTNPKLVVLLGGKETTINGVIDTVSGIECYAFSFNNVAPQMMNDTIEAKLYADWNGNEYSSETVEYSVATYIYSMLGSTTNAEFRTMLVDMLRYGSAAQVYTKYNTSNLVDSKLTAEQAAWGTASVRNLSTVKNIPSATASDSAKWVGMSLYLDSKVAIRGYFDVPSKDGVYVEVADENGNVYDKITAEDFTEVTGPENTPVVSFVYDGLNFAQMSKTVKLTVCDSAGNKLSGTAVYSIESYVYSTQSSTVSGLADLVKAMIVFGDASNAYAN